jgi:hypothetical protein
LQIPKLKYQDPNKEIPNLKLQEPKKKCKIPRPMKQLYSLELEIWISEFIWSLDLGAWNLYSFGT